MLPRLKHFLILAIAVSCFILYKEWMPRFSNRLTILILNTAKGCGMPSSVELKYWFMTYPSIRRGSSLTLKINCTKDVSLIIQIIFLKNTQKYRYLSFN